MNQDVPTSEKSEDKNPEQEQLMEQYKTYLQTIDYSAEKRLNTNQFFMTINSFLVTLFSTIAGYMFVSGKGPVFLLVPLSVMGYGVSRVWYFFLKNYTTANSAKWDAVYKLEEKLPNKPFLSEWKDGLEKIYTSDMPKGFSWLSGDTPKRYYSTSSVESALPKLFGWMYICLGLGTVIYTIGKWLHTWEWLYSKFSAISENSRNLGLEWIGIPILFLVVIVVVVIMIIVSSCNSHE